ncbi:hypothetical protein [Phormidium pseudopriestleyi]|nr:hypothetical protein [Phormidium pseudopriestleyi]
MPSDSDEVARVGGIWRSPAVRGPIASGGSSKLTPVHGEMRSA